MKIGLMQGRLCTPVDGHIQEFPHKHWRNEVDQIKQLGLHGVEWLVTNKSYPSNPILENGTFSKYPIISVCLDVIIDSRIDDAVFLDDVISSCYNSGVRRFTIPLLEESDMRSDSRRRLFCDRIEGLGSRFCDATFSFEAELEMDKLDDIVLLRDNFKVTYDTGNITSFGIDHEEYINHFKHKIDNVHLKDRTFGANTVYPSTGDTNFSKIFKLLKFIGYNGAYVIQTARGKTGSEAITITEHKKIFEELYHV